jgi:soluble lytic murein transglycosylase-like protein
MRRTAAPQAFARTDSFESGWQQSQGAQQQWQRQSRRENNRQPQNGWQQRDVSQASPEWSDPSSSLDRGVNRAERSSARASHGALDAMIASHAAANGLPVELVHRVVKRESGYNPGARNPSGALGLMQIKYATARGVGYSGSASGLFDAETNLTYAVKYLAGAFQAAGGNANRAVALYQSGYHGRGVAVARRTPRMAAPEQVASNWGGQSWDMQTERVAMQDVDVTAVRVHRGHRWRHRR